MSHALFVGVTESGKTTLARAMARRYSALGQNVIVYDPVGTATAGGDWPEKSVRFWDEAEFWKYINRDDVGHAHVFIDEAGDVFNLGRRENFWLLTRGRHYGLFVNMMCQRPTMIAPTVRTQAATCYMFRLANSDAKEICADMGHNWPLAGNTENDEFVALDRGDFYTLHSGRAQYERRNIFSLLSRKVKP